MEDESIMENVEEKQIIYNGKCKERDIIFNSTYEELDSNYAINEAEMMQNVTKRDQHQFHQKNLITSRPLDFREPQQIAVMSSMLSAGGSLKQISPIKSLNPYRQCKPWKPETQISNIYEPMSPVKLNSNATASKLNIYQPMTPVKMKSTMATSNSPPRLNEYTLPMKIKLKKSNESPKQQRYLSHSRTYEEIPSLHIKSNDLTSYDEPLELMQSTHLPSEPTTPNSVAGIYVEMIPQRVEKENSKLFKDSLEETSETSNSSSSSLSSSGIYEQISPIKFKQKSYHSGAKPLNYEHSYAEPLFVEKFKEDDSITAEAYEKLSPVKSKLATPRSLFPIKMDDNITLSVSPKGDSLSSNSYEEPQNVMEFSNSTHIKDLSCISLSRTYEEIPSFVTPSTAVTPYDSFEESSVEVVKKKSLKSCFLSLVRRKSHNSPVWCKSNSWMRITAV
uniref:Uncharacterized protein n=1 Tax=Stomoxys calcitrans TaxID=35570 RepID=A0A1I8P5Y2_STOCA